MLFMYNIVMLYIASGNNFTARKKHTDSLLDAMQKKRPGAELVRLDFENFSGQKLEQHISGMGLFDDKSIVYVSGIFEHKEYKNYFLEKLEDVVSSDNAFIVSEENISALDIKKINKYTKNVQLFDTPKTKQVNSLFVFGDLLLQKNKQTLLTNLYVYINNGTSTEEIVGILVWQIKSLCLALSYSQIESGLKPFVYKKCTTSLWNKKDALVMYKKIITQYHESRRGGLTLQERLELLILEL